MTRILSAGLASCALLLGPGCSDSPTQPSDTVTLTAALSPANEVPAVTNADASGSGVVTIVLHLTRDTSGTITAATADFQVSLTGFPPLTTLTTAGVHSGAAGSNGPLIVDTGLGAGEVVLASGSGGFSKTGISVLAAAAQNLLANPTGFYFNVHTVLNGNGAARGQLVRS